MTGLAAIFGTPMPAAAVERQPGQKGISDVVVGASGAVRAQLAGGFLPQLALHSSLQPIEEVFRKLPTAGLYTATPTRPFTIFMGSYTVPDNMVLFLLDWRFDIYRPSASIVGDTVPVEERSWALSIGWDVQFSDKRPSTNAYEITPALPPPGLVGNLPNQGVPSSDDAFARMRAMNTQLPGGAGMGMLPQRHRRDVQPQMPFTYILQPRQVVQMRMIAINPVSIALAFFEAEFSGLIVGATTFQRFVSSAAPSIESTVTP